jgi:thiamine-phosphate diphosphorylase
VSIRQRLSVAKYLVVGPENTLGRPVRAIVSAAAAAGFTCIQIRSKVASAGELIRLCGECADELARLGKSDSVALLVDDRLDVVLAARDAGIKVDGIHVGQSDIPTDVCRRHLGEDAVVGLSAPTRDLIDFARTADLSGIDYLGAGPLHPTPTKSDCGLDEMTGEVVVRTLGELEELARVSPLPVVVGGGVKVEDLPALAATGVAGFFVVSAVAGAEDPEEAAKALCAAWRQA